jgi:hypothetical protein
MGAGPSGVSLPDGSVISEAENLRRVRASQDSWTIANNDHLDPWVPRADAYGSGGFTRAAVSSDFRASERQYRSDLETMSQGFGDFLEGFGGTAGQPRVAPAEFHAAGLRLGLDDARVGKAYGYQMRIEPGSGAEVAYDPMTGLPVNGGGWTNGGGLDDRIGRAAKWLVTPIESIKNFTDVGVEPAMRTMAEMDALAKSPESGLLTRMAANLTLGHLASSAGAVDGYVPDSPLGLALSALSIPAGAKFTFGVVDDVRLGTSGPYNARMIGQALEEAHPGQVTSSTLPTLADRNVSLAGTRHPVSGVVFDTRGFPIFDDIAAFDTRIGSKYSAVEDSTLHMRAATRDLREAIERGEVAASQFTETQLRAIQGGKPKIPDWTWHHHQDVGRMQLIPTVIHKQTGHVGGFELWFRN